MTQDEEFVNMIASNPHWMDGPERRQMICRIANRIIRERDESDKDKTCRDWRPSPA